MIRSIFTNFSARLSVAAFNFVMLLMITHYLGAGIYGQISVIALNVSIIHLISDLAGGPSLVYLTPRTKLSSLFVTGSAWSFINSIGIGCILVYSGIFPMLYWKEVLLIGLVISLNSLNQNIILGQQRIKAYNILTFAQGFLQLLTLSFFIFIYRAETAYPYIIACLVSNSVCYAAGLLLVFRYKYIPHIPESRSLLLLLFSNGFYTQAASLFILFCKTICFNNMKSFLPDGEKAVGVFNSAFSLAGAILLFGASVSAVVMSKVANHENHLETRVTVFRLSKLSFVLTAIGVSIFLLLPANFYSWLIGKEFSPVKSIFIPMAPGVVLLSLGTVFTHYFSGAGKHIMNFITAGLTLLVTWLVTPYLVKTYGLAGAGISTSVTYIVMTVLISIAFILAGHEPMKELRHLLPEKNDISSLKNIFKK